MILSIIGIVLLVAGGVCLYLNGVPAATAGLIVAAAIGLTEVVKKALPKKVEK